MNQALATTEPRERRSLLLDMAERYGMEPKAFADTLKATVVPKETSNEQFAAFLLVAKEYDLNPLTKEIYAFPKPGGGIQPIVPVDGWVHLVNANPAFDGLEFDDHLDKDNKLQAITARIWRKDRARPIVVTEYMIECQRNTDTWRQWPRRMLRHKAMIQCARYAFGFAGIVDPDEAERGRDVSPMRTVSDDGPPTPPDRDLALVESGRDDGRRIIMGEDREIPIDEPPQNFDEQSWLTTLHNELQTCNDHSEVGEVQAQSMMPYKDRVSITAWEQAEHLIRQTLGQLEGK